MSKKITDLTPFVFEDGNIYYFAIWQYTNSYHHIYVYEKKKFSKRKWFKKVEYEKMVQVGDPDLIKIDLNINEIKSKISTIIRSTKPNKIDGWDGFVGDVPDDLKKAFMRSSKINNILD